MSYMDDFDDIFGVGIPPVEEIPIDEEEESKRYMLSMYERLNRLREKHSLEEEVISSSSTSGKSTSIIFSDDSAEELEPDVLQIETFLTVNEKGTYDVPILNRGGMKH